MVTKHERAYRAVIHDLKHPDGALARIPITSDGQHVANLRPIPAELTGEAANDAALMSSWRNANREHFFTWIRATPEATADWLRDTYSEDDESIIFIVETTEGEPLGQISLYNFDVEPNACEIGRILRGEPLGPPGVYTMVMLGTMEWAEHELGIQRFWLEAFDHNDRAMALYERCGFVRTTRYPCVRVEEPKMIRWEKLPEHHDPSELVDGYIVRMERSAQ